MSKRDGFLFTFQSPYDLNDTLRAFCEVLNGVFTTPKGEQVISALNHRDELPLTSGIFIQQTHKNALRFVIGNKSQVHWEAEIICEGNDSGTLGQVMLDRPKNKMGYYPAVARHDEYLVFKHDLVRELFQRASFKILKQDMS